MKRMSGRNKERERKIKCDCNDIPWRIERSPEEAEAESIQIDFLGSTGAYRMWNGSTGAN